MDCIFCKIIHREIPSTPVYEDEEYLVIPDIHPKSRIHLLFLPKRHIESIAHLEDIDRETIGGLLLLARDIAKREGIPGYRLQFNVGKDGGQEVMHIHLHLLAN